MDETSQQVCLLFEGAYGLLPLLRTQPLLAHLLDGPLGMLEEGILGLIDRAKPSLSYPS
jgi:hypothetical protein